MGLGIHFLSRVTEKSIALTIAVFLIREPSRHNIFSMNNKQALGISHVSHRSRGKQLLFTGG